MNHETEQTAKTQLDKFKEAAREHEAGEDETHWERLEKIAKATPQQEKPE